MSSHGSVGNGSGHLMKREGNQKKKRKKVDERHAPYKRIQSNSEKKVYKGVSHSLPSRTVKNLFA